MFDYLRPSTVYEALELLQRYGDRAMVVAGGTDVMVGVRRKKFSPDVLISLKGVVGLDGIGSCNEGASIGAMATHRQVGESSLVRRHFAALADGVNKVGSLQIRNVATIGGNIVSALPSADSACALLALDTRLRLKNLSGERTLPLRDFYIAPGRTALQKDELLLEFMLPEQPPSSASAYWKHTRRKAMDIAILGLGMVMSAEVKDAAPFKQLLVKQVPIEALQEALDRSEIYCRQAKIALGVAAPTPVRSSSAEALLQGERLTIQLLRLAGLAASEESRPRDSMRGPAWYRKKMIEVLVPRVALNCLRRILSGTEKELAGQ